MSLTDIYPRETADDPEKQSPATSVGSVVGAGIRAFYAAMAGLLLTCSLGVVIWAVTPSSGSGPVGLLRAGVAAFSSANGMTVTIGRAALTMPPLMITLVAIALLATVSGRGTAGDHRPGTGTGVDRCRSRRLRGGRDVLWCSARAGRSCVGRPVVAAGVTGTGRRRVHHPGARCRLAFLSSPPAAALGSGVRPPRRGRHSGPDRRRRGHRGDRFGAVVGRRDHSCVVGRAGRRRRVRDGPPRYCVPAECRRGRGRVRVRCRLHRGGTEPTRRSARRPPNCPR